MQDDLAKRRHGKIAKLILPVEGMMKKRPLPSSENVTPVKEKALAVATGAHVDNPAQAAMKDGP